MLSKPVSNPNVFMELGRVTFVNPERFTVDVATESGRLLKDVPFLSPYALGGQIGQTVVSMPEVNAYTLVIKLVPIGRGTLHGTDTFCFGYFTPVDARGSFAGNRERMAPGEHILKTGAGNKLFLTNDGVVLAYASDLSQIRLFPASGNVQDSAGKDHLIQFIMENLELYASGGRFEWKVNKKRGSTNFIYEMKNKPLLEQNPDYILGQIGGQGDMDDDSYFHTKEQFNTRARGKEHIKRVDVKEKIDGTREVSKYEGEDGKLAAKDTEDAVGGRTHSTFNPDTEKPYVEWEEDHLGNKVRKTYDGNGTIQHEIDLRSTGEMTETHYSGGSPIWKMQRGSDGTTRLDMPGDGSMIHIEITAQGKLSIKTAQDVSIESDENIHVKAQKNATVEAGQTATVKAGEKAVIDAPETEISVGEGGGQKVAWDSLFDIFNNHTHTVSGGVAAAPTAKMEKGKHSSEIVSTG